MDISVVIPLLNEKESLKELCAILIDVLQTEHLDSEILFIDDGSTDDSWRVITDLSQTHAMVKGFRFLKNYGKSQALHWGFLQAQGEVVITMDADLQDNPKEIPKLYTMITETGYDLVSGWKKKRYDSFLGKNLPSKLFNTAARFTSGIPLHDFNCGLKAYKNIVVKNIDVYGEMHRYIPILAKNAGFTKIGETVVLHQARKYGKTKFGANRFINGFLDLITIWFMSRFAKRPMHFFGLLGSLMFLIGFSFSIYLGVDKLFLEIQGRPIAQRPEFYIALTAMLLGTQFFLTGFISEMVLTSKRSKQRYTVIQRVGIDTSN